MPEIPLTAPTTDLPILIIGAGITGLILAQGLRARDIPFILFERDDALDTRSHGWGLTIHWALPTLKSLLPAAVYKRLREAEVDPQQSGKRDLGRFQLLDLSTGRPLYVTHSARRLRVSRRLLRERLLEGLEVRWGMGLVDFRVLGGGRSGEGVEARFENSSIVKGRLLVGADGAGSQTRRILCPETGKCLHLPIRFMGCTIRLSRKEMSPFREIDPLLFQGNEPATGVFMWFSVLSTPETNGSGPDWSRNSDRQEMKEEYEDVIDKDEMRKETEVNTKGRNKRDYFEVQLGLSWMLNTLSDETPKTNEARLRKLKDMAAPFEESLRELIVSIPQGTEIREVKIQDWDVVDWDNHNGNVTLIGDAAHAMTMYRGEGVNYGIKDVKLLLDALLMPGKKSQHKAIDHYEEEMKHQAREAVLLSRQACFDAHDFNKLKDDSPLVARRTVEREPAISLEK